jgi:hypothetical protein
MYNGIPVGPSSLSVIADRECCHYGEGYIYLEFLQIVTDECGMEGNVLEFTVCATTPRNGMIAT